MTNVAQLISHRIEKEHGQRHVTVPEGHVTTHDTGADDCHRWNAEEGGYGPIIGQPLDCSNNRFEDKYII